MTYFLAFLVDASSSSSAFLLPEPSPSCAGQGEGEGTLRYDRHRRQPRTRCSALFPGLFVYLSCCSYSVFLFKSSEKHISHFRRSLQEQPVPYKDYRFLSCLFHLKEICTIGFHLLPPPSVLHHTAPRLASRVLHLPRHCPASWPSSASGPYRHLSPHRCRTSRSSLAPLQWVELGEKNKSLFLDLIAIIGVFSNSQQGKKKRLNVLDVPVVCPHPSGLLLPCICS